MTEAMINPLSHPVCLEYPLWMRETAWAQHIPFGMYLVSALRPQVLVELGAYKGVSYCALCQAVKRLSLNARCYAIDTWSGDAHSGALGDEVLIELKSHHEPLYGDFSLLVRSTFDDALAHFEHRSIDLLHIDGFHSYEAVRHDFESWLPKMSPRGVVLLHDTNVRERGFGVWQFWSETRERFPHFEFLHGHGLGVLAVGTEPPDAVLKLAAVGDVEARVLREFFYQLGARIELKHVHAEVMDYVGKLQIYESAIKKSRVMRAYNALGTKMRTALGRT